MRCDNKLLRSIIAVMIAAALLWMPQVSAAVYAEDDITYHETGDEAAAELREAMKERREKVTIGVLGKTDQNGLKEIIGAFLDRATEHTGEPTEGDYINFQYASYKGAAQTALDGLSPAIRVEYTLEYYDNAEQEKAVDEKVSEITGKLGLGRKTDYEKLVAIYNYICSTTEYEQAADDSDIRRTAYGALVEGKAVCQGYSIALYRLLLEAGIDNRIIYGKGLQPDGGEGPHTWNIVDLYGKYYYVDVTWDDATYGREYFLRPAGSGFENEHKADEEYPEDYFTEQYPLATEPFPGDIGGSTLKILWAAQDTEEILRQGVRSVLPEKEAETGGLPEFLQNISRALKQFLLQ